MNSKNNEFGIYFCIFAISIALIFISLYLGEHIFSSLLKELGFAGIIAVAVIFSVERFAKEKQTEFVEELIKKINKSSLLAIYNKKLPKSVFDEIEKIILAAGTYRQNNRITYDFCLHDGLPLNLIVTYKTEYTLFCTSDKPVPHTLKVCLEKPRDTKLLPLCHMVSVKCGSLTLSKEDILRYTSETESHLEFFYPIVLIPDQGVDVTIISSLIRLKTDVEVWSSLIPTEHLEVTVTAHPPIKNLDIVADSLHPDVLVKVSKSGLTHRWLLSQPILPHQGYVIWWNVS